SLSNPPSPSPTYTLPLHDALPISFSRPTTRTTPLWHWRRLWLHLHDPEPVVVVVHVRQPILRVDDHPPGERRILGEALHVCRIQDRKSTRLNSSHVSISYAVFCLK